MTLTVALQPQIRTKQQRRRNISLSRPWTTTQRRRAVEVAADNAGAIWTAVASVGSAGIALLGKSLWDARKTLAEANKVNADAAKVEADIEQASLKALTERMENAEKGLAEWIARYSSSVAEVGQLTGKVGQLEAHVARLEGRVAELDAAKVAAEKTIEVLRKDNTALRRENKQLTGEVTRLTVEFNTAMDGFQGAMIMLEGVAANDTGLSSVADERIRKAAALEQERRDKMKREKPTQ